MQRPGPGGLPGVRREEKFIALSPVYIELLVKQMDKLIQAKVASDYDPTRVYDYTVALSSVMILVPPSVKDELAARLGQKLARMAQAARLQGDERAAAEAEALLSGDGHAATDPVLVYEAVAGMCRRRTAEHPRRHAERCGSRVKVYLDMLVDELFRVLHEKGVFYHYSYHYVALPVAPGYQAQGGGVGDG